MELERWPDPRFVDRAESEDEAMVWTMVTEFRINQNRMRTIREMTRRGHYTDFHTEDEAKVAQKFIAESPKAPEPVPAEVPSSDPDCGA